MRRSTHGAGWRPRPGRHRSVQAIATVFESGWQPTRGASAIDPELGARFNRAIFEPEGAGLQRSIRIPPGEHEDWQTNYLTLAAALDGHSQLIIGWWIGEASDPVHFMGSPLAEVPLARGTDLDLAVWRVERERLRELLEACGVPTLLATGEPGWVLISPPASDDMFLYPEVSASGA